MLLLMHHSIPCNCPLCAIALAIAPLALVLSITCHPRRHHHCSLHCLHCCSPATLGTIAIALLPSLSLSLTHGHRHFPHRYPPQLSLPPLPLLLLDHHLCPHCHHCHCHRSPPLLPLQFPPLCLCLHLPATLVAAVSLLGGGRGGPYQSGAQSNFGHRRWCCHHHCCRCHPCDWPGGAGQAMCRHSMPGRRRVLTWRGCCWCSYSRHLPPRRPMMVAAAVCRLRWLRHWQWGNKVNKDSDNNTTTTKPPKQ